MMSSFKVIKVAALAVLLSAGLVAQAQAATVSISPVSQTVDLSDPSVSVDIVVSGLTEDIGGFSAVLSFNGTILTGDSYVNDPDGHFDNDIDLSFGFTGGTGSPLDLFLTGDPVTQGTGFTLAHVTFIPAAIGLSPLTLSGVVLSNALGGQSFTPTVENGSICVTTATAPADICRQQVPEPGLLALLGAGVTAIAARRRKAAGSRA